MAYRWKARTATPGGYNFKAGSLGFAPDPAHVRTITHIGDGTPGTLNLDLYHLIAPSTTGLAPYEQRNGRRYFRHGREGVYVRTYDVPIDSVPAMPKAGDFFPGETSGPRIIPDGVSAGPVAEKGNIKRIGITISASQPAYAGAATEAFAYAYPG